MKDQMTEAFLALATGYTGEAEISDVIDAMSDALAVLEDAEEIDGGEGGHSHQPVKREYIFLVSGE